MHAEGDEALDCNPSLTQCEAGAFLQFLTMAPKPDKRAGTVSKTDRAMGIARGASPLRGRHFYYHVGLAEQSMHSSCKRDHVGADPTADSISFHGPIAQSVEHLTLIQKVDGANPSGAPNL